MEEWKSIQRLEGYYEVSSYGFIRSKERKVKNGNGYRKVRERIIKTGIDNAGYYYANLKREGKYYPVKPHRLTAIAFVPNPENKPEVNHKDSNKLNNHYTNLEWVTPLENTHHNFLSGKTSSNVKLSCKDVFEILKYHKAGMKNSQIAEIMGVTRKTIWRINSGKSWKFLTEKSTNEEK